MTVDDGLSQNLINVLYSDSRGFLWIGTNDGLNRYDGFINRVYQFSITDSTTITSNLVNTINETPDGNIILSHGINGISKLMYKTNRFNRYPLFRTGEEKRKWSRIHDIEVTSEGKIYVVTEAGLVAYDELLDEFYLLSSQKDFENVRYIFAEAGDNLIIGTLDGEIWRYNTSTGEYLTLSGFAASNYANTNAFESLGNANYAISRADSVYFYNVDSDSISFSIKVAENVRTLHYDGSRLWIATDDMNLYLYSTVEETNSEHLNDSIIKSNRTTEIRSLATTYDGSLWVGTIGFGITKVYDRSRWFGHLSYNSSTKDSIYNISIRSILPINPHEILIGGYNELERFSFLTGQSQILKTHDNKRFPYIAYKMKKDPLDEDIIWIGTEGEGLVRFNLKEQNYSRYMYDSNSYRANIVQDFVWIGSDSLMIATDDGLKFLNLSDKSEFVINDLKLISNEAVTFIEEIRHGHFYVGSPSGRLLRVEKNGSGFFVDYLLDDSLSGMRLFSLTSDSNGNIWVGSDNGLIEMDSTYTIKQFYTIETGLPNNTVYSVQFDSAEDLWISTNRGISRFNRKSKSFTNYTLRDGLQSNEFNSKAYANWNNEILFLGGINGLNYFMPSSIRSDTTAHKLYIEELQTQSAVYQIENQREIKLTYVDKEARISYSSPIFYNPHATKVYYRLANIDTVWRAHNHDNELILQNLMPGQHRLQMTRSDEYSLTSAPISELLIRIAPPFYQLWYLQFAFFMLIIGLIGYVVISYMQKLKYEIYLARSYSQQLMVFQDQDRKRVADALHDSVGSKLMLIKLTFQQVLMTVNDSFAEKKYQEISDLIGDTINEIRDMSHNLHPHLLEIIGLEKSLVSFFSSLEEIAPIKFSWEIQSIDGYLNSEETLIYYRFIQECITNVLKHSKAGNCRISIVIDEKNNTMVTEIADDGMGFEVSNKKNETVSMGFRTFKERADFIGAEFSFESQPEKGTTIRLEKKLH